MVHISGSLIWHFPRVVFSFILGEVTFKAEYFTRLFRLTLFVWEEISIYTQSIIDLIESVSE